VYIFFNVPLLFFRQESHCVIRQITTTLLLFLLGAAFLCALSVLQKILLGVPLGKPYGYIIPFIFGGTTGVLLGMWSIRLKEANRCLRAKEQRYRTLYRKTPCMLHSIDTQGRLIEVSDTWLETMNYQREAVIGRQLTDFMTPASRRYAQKVILPDFFSRGSVRDIAYQMVRRNGETLDVLLSAVIEKDDGGQFQRSLAIMINVTERKKAEQQIEKLAYFDTLTGLPNRKLFQDRLDQTLAQARRRQSIVAVIFLDLDNFKSINDSHGHTQGDILLQRVAEQLQRCVRAGDTVARLGGDEFVLVLTSEPGEDKILAFVQRLCNTLHQPISLEGQSVHITASIGVAVFPKNGQDSATLIKAADIAMYAAKDQGRNNFQFFSAEMSERTKARADLESRLNAAIERKEFRLVYQPPGHLGDGRITGVEALLRWDHPEDGEILPGRFLECAEKSGLIHPIGQWVLQAACSQARQWQQQGFAPLRVAVNISARQFSNPAFIDIIDKTLEESGLDPEWLELELTESAMMENVLRTVMTLTDLKVRNIRLSIDDFGTGYSSLSYLKHFPINRIKIAQEFVRDIPDNHDDAAIVETMITMARHLELGIIAEGVERKAQIDFLTQRNCLEMQGYYFSRPLPADELSDLLKQQTETRAFCLFRPDASASLLL
jgi:diguanylate cyclase (GGDEF)-like protein/PAS domain S-box-containing protein